MEKKRAHYDLAAVHEAVARLGIRAFSRLALKGGLEMGLSIEDMLETVASLAPKMLHKSMTTYADHTIWQDVYHARTPNNRTAYVKLTMRNAAPVVQFKEK